MRLEDNDSGEPAICADCGERDGRHHLGCPSDPVEIELAAVRRRVAASLPVDAVIAALEDGRSPNSILTVAQVKRELAHAFGRDVLVHSGRIRSREEDR